MKITTLKNPSRKPHIYKVTNLETHQYYIGSQCSGKIVGMNYFTSSHNKEFKDGFKNYGEEKYKIEIIKEFVNPKECVRAENLMIRDHMLLKDGLCLNRACCCNGEKIFSTVGWHHSEETRKKLSISKSEETRKKLSEAHKGMRLPDETRKKISKTMQGRQAKNQIKISIEDVTFESITEASKYYNVSITAISYWLKTKKHNAVYIK